MQFQKKSIPTAWKVIRKFLGWCVCGGGGGGVLKAKIFGSKVRS